MTYRPPNKLRELMIKKQREADEIRREYVQSGDHKRLMDKVNEKADKSHIDPDDLFN